ncbi:MAG: tetratricopeptide repeat protein [Planctomycetota bacterium]
MEDPSHPIESDSTQDRIADLLARVLAMPEGERMAELKARVDGDVALERELESLVGATVRAGRFLEGVEAARGAADEPESIAAGTRIGRYTLVRPLGEGGFGSVWLAEQTDPVARVVALKVIKAGMDTKQVIARFELERQTLALLDHPSIAKILDAGSTSWGRPYFVMEWIDGVPISEYCRSEALSTRERIDLFTHVCLAIQHAHQKGVIHRDIKPNNVLVSVRDGVALPKVIDFGIAKATGGVVSGSTAAGDVRMLLGTPAYMSPEQASLSALDIDTRSDIYSLGVLLYELLAHEPPFGAGALASLDLSELQRTIRDVTPPLPSERASSAPRPDAVGALDAPASSRRGGGAELRGDLDWIVMKCLEKERSRRYDTASALAEDLRRHLTHLPVAAGPPSTAYRVRKFVRRNRGYVVAAAVAVMALGLGTGGLAIGLSRAIESSRRADAEATRARALAVAAGAARDEALSARREADERAEELQVVTSFQANRLAQVDVQGTGMELRALLVDALGDASQPALQSKFDELDFAELARLLLERRILLPTIDAIDLRFPDRPRIQAQLLQATAAGLRAIGSFEESARAQSRAVVLFDEALGPLDPDTLFARLERARVFDGMGDRRAARAWGDALLADVERAFGDGHRAQLATLNFLGRVSISEGRFDLAVEQLTRAADGFRRLAGEGSIDALLTEVQLAYALSQLGQYERARALLSGLLPRLAAARGDRSREVLEATGHRAIAELGLGQLAEGEASLRAAALGFAELLGAGHPLTLTARSNLGNFLVDQRRLAEAEVELRDVVEGRRVVLGARHPQTIFARASLARLAKVRGDYALATSQYEEALRQAREVLGADHPRVFDWLGELGHIRWRTKRFAEAVPFFQEAVECGARILPEGDPRLRLARANLGINLRESGAVEEAVRWLEAACLGGGGAPDERFVGELLATYSEAGKADAALDLCRARLAAARASLPAGSVELASKLADCGLQLVRGGAASEAEQLLRECLAIRAAAEPDAWTSWNSRVLLGAALLGQGRRDEAEPLLLAGYRGLIERESSIPSRSRQAIDHAIGLLVRLYAEAGAAGDADAGSKEREWEAIRQGRGKGAAPK